jgi:predicted RNA methylase
MKYEQLKRILDDLNKDNSHFASSNDICTPMDCVEEMVDSIPNELWQRSSINVLDPCAGNGNFPAYVLQKSDNINLTANEISNLRTINLKNNLSSYNNVSFTSKDFLTERMDDKYDLIIANPPYALIMDNGKRAAKNHNLSRDFILKSLEYLKEDGYLVYIIPDNWMSLSDRNDTVEILSQYHFVKLDIHGAKRHFKGVGSSFTWFVLKKTTTKGETIIANNYRLKQQDNVLLESMEHIPLFYNEQVKSIINKTLNSTKQKFEVLTTSYLHKYTKKHFLSSSRDSIFRYELIHTPKQTVWSSKEHKYQKGWKTFISLTSYYETFARQDVGMTQSIAFIPQDDEESATRTAAVLMHPLYTFLNEIHRYGNFNNIRILQRFPMPDKDDIWESFDISEEEKALILKFLKIS